MSTSSLIYLWMQLEGDEWCIANCACTDAADAVWLEHATSDYLEMEVDELIKDTDVPLGSTTVLVTGRLENNWVKGLPGEEYEEYFDHDHIFFLYDGVEDDGVS